ncbi:MAG: hypothetical protein OEU92_05425 [Alphaproteobacteria bacterium]|nr:hypothetical protein [Alphaproteobacteria bacterium]
MTRPNGTEDAFDTSFGVQGPDAVTFPAHGVQPTGGGLRDIVPVLAFLRREIDQSATILRDIARCLSDEICALGASSDGEFLQPRLSQATIALQNEDRVQQRLRDMGATLSMLEHMLAEGDLAAGDDLGRAVIDSLRLEETRRAFAIDVGMTDRSSQPSGPVGPPSVGEIDLF